MPRRPAPCRTGDPGVKVATKIQQFARLQWQPLALVFALAVVFRLAIALWLPAEIVWDDGHRYRTVADNLLAGRGFGTLPENALSVPTQPVLIAAVDLMTGGGYRAQRIFFALLGSVTCVLGYLLSRRLFGSTAALLGGCLLAVYPYLAYCSALFEYPQTFFIGIMSLVFLLFYVFIDSGRKLTLFACGLCLGLGILSVPTALLFIPCMMLSLWNADARQALVYCVILLAAVSVPVGSWAARNYLAYGQFVLINEAGGRNFWSANNETYYQFGKQAVVRPCKAPYEDTAFCREFRDLGIHVGDGGLTDQQIVIAYEKAGWHRGWRYVRESPGHFLLLVGKKFLTYWSPIPDALGSGPEHGGESRNWVAILSYCPILLLAVVGCVLSARQWRRLLVVYLYFLTFTAAYALFLPTTRYRLPLDFFLALFAGYALARVVERRGSEGVADAANAPGESQRAWAVIDGRD
jgi:4-amino-4-deoxy-L-arabinose transferase-like glycosyltransferase